MIHVLVVYKIQKQQYDVKIKKKIEDEYCCVQMLFCL